jgi:hypothetical protein
MTDQILFDPARMPARDENGWVSHPDLDQPRWNKDEELLNVQAFVDAGYDVHFTMMEYDLTDDHPTYHAYYEGDSSDLSGWEPSKPEGEGWWLIAIYDSEDGPWAMYIRHHVEVPA